MYCTKMDPENQAIKLLKFLYGPFENVFVNRYDYHASFLPNQIYDSESEYVAETGPFLCLKSLVSGLDLSICPDEKLVSEIGKFYVPDRSLLGYIFSVVCTSWYSTSYDVHTMTELFHSFHEQYPELYRKELNRFLSAIIVDIRGLRYLFSENNIDYILNSYPGIYVLIYAVPDVLDVKSVSFTFLQILDEFQAGKLSEELFYDKLVDLGFFMMYERYLEFLEMLKPRLAFA